MILFFGIMMKFRAFESILFYKYLKEIDVLLEFIKKGLVIAGNGRIL